MSHSCDSASRVAFHTKSHIIMDHVLSYKNTQLVGLSKELEIMGLGECMN